LLSKKLLPATRHIAGDCYTLSSFQQDNAPAHRVRETVELLQNEPPDFIKPNLLPPDSPDPNYVDYKTWGLWGVMQEGVHQKPVRNVDELKQRLIAAWSGIQQTVIDQTTDQWRERLNACVKAKGKLFEHLF